jgi:hypothetical protein
MARKALIVAFGMIVAASPVSATKPEPNAMTPAPTGSANTKYCLRVEPVTGTRLEFVRCWTRQEWAEQDVDVDKEWAENGVAVIS